MSQALPIGTILHGRSYHYCIEKVLGQGSFGITYLARVKLAGALGELQSEVRVAVKEFFMRDVNGRSGTHVLTGGGSDLYHKYRKDFIREAENLSKLKHPHIVKVLEAFEDNNTAYFSMEYIEGGNLNEYIQSSDGLSEREALESILQISEALSFMHMNKMLHLDLKPLNIMRRKDGELVLIDFGLSRQFASNGELESSTRLGCGTPGYAALEQYNYKKTDGFAPTLDIYALGAILFKMLAANTPPDASTVFNEGFPEESMSSRGIGAGIIALTSKAMNPLKKMRHQTALEFAAEVRKILPSASSRKAEPAKKPGRSSLDKTPVVEGFEVCNGFNVRWPERLDEWRKGKIRELLQSMNKHGEVWSLEGSFWHYLYPLITGPGTVGYFPPCTLRLAIKALQMLVSMTSLPFRFADENEGRFAVTFVPGASLDKTLIYSSDKRLQYRQIVGSGRGLYDISTYDEMDSYQYDVQLICEGQMPVHDNRSFLLVEDTQEFFEEISPIGFGLYKVRRGTFLNVRSPRWPMSDFLPDGFDYISDIGLWHIPGPGPRSGWDYIGIEAKKGNLTFFYEFRQGSFKLLSTLSSEDIAERQAWT